MIPPEHLQQQNQWREVADARESQERPQTSDEELERYLMRHSRKADQEPPKVRGWVLFVITCVLMLLGSLYVLSCGVTPWGACWK